MFSIWERLGIGEYDYPQETIGYKESIAFGAAVFNNQENRPDFHPLYFLIWRIITQMTQAGLIWVEVQITEERCNCRRRGAAHWDSSKADCTGCSIMGHA